MAAMLRENDPEEIDPMYAPGTRVRVGRRFGRVVSAEKRPSFPTGFHVVHIVEFTSEIVTQSGRTSVIPISPITQEIRYAYVEPII